MRGRVRHDEDLRVALEEQIAERNRKLKGRRYFVEPKIGSSPTPYASYQSDAASPSPIPEPHYSRVSPERSARYVRADGRRSVEFDHERSSHDAKTAELRAALEEQIEAKKRREAELKARERLESRELLVRASVMEPLADHPTVPSQFSHLPVISSGFMESKAPLPENWHSHEFLDLAKKDDEERQRKQAERAKAEVLRGELERQIREKEESRRSQARMQLNAEREYEAKQQRIRELAASNERKRQDEASRAQQQLQHDNLVMAQQHRNSPSRVRVESSLAHPLASSPARTDHVTDVSSQQQHGVAAPMMGPAQVLGAAAPVDQSGDVRSILSRIHNELLLQRQDLLSPSIFSAIPASNVSRLAMGGPLPTSNAAEGNALPMFGGMGELPADRQMVRKDPLKHHYVSPRVTLKKQPIFSMTDWMAPQGVDSGASPFASEPVCGYDHVSETLRRNQQRLRQIRFAKHNDDVLRIFLQQDNPSAVAGSYDLPPPSVLHNTQDMTKR